MGIEGSRIAFIGTGVMGRSMAGQLLKAGVSVTVFNRTKARAAELLASGAAWADTPALAAKGATVVFTMVGYPADVEEVYFGPNGILAGAEQGAILVDHTTSSPRLAERIAVECGARGFEALDAPVSGGDIGARNASLSIMVGGDKAVFERVKPYFDRMGSSVVLQGGHGSGQHAKMANQIAIAGCLTGVVESLVYAEKAGLDPATVISSISGGAAGSWQLANMAPRMLAGNFDPGFFSKHYLKDLRIALDAAKEMGINLPLLSLGERLFTLMSEKGFSEKGTHALYLLYRSGDVPGYSAN